MSAENAPAVFFDQRFVSVDRLCNSARGIPVLGFFDLDVELDACRAGLVLAHPYRTDWRQREPDARHTAIIRLVVVAFEKIGRDDPAIMARYRREWRTLSHHPPHKRSGWKRSAKSRSVRAGGFRRRSRAVPPLGVRTGACCGGTTAI